MHMHYLWYWMGIKREKTRGVLFTQSRQKYSFVREREDLDVKRPSLLKGKEGRKCTHYSAIADYNVQMELRRKKRKRMIWM